MGIGIGFASMTVPVYIAETSPPLVRGKLITLYQLNITTGILVASLVNGAFSYLHHDGWRWMLGVSAVPSVIMFVGCLIAPESPRWLIQNDKIEGKKFGTTSEEAISDYHQRCTVNETIFLMI